jgi:hypothetical protein
MMTILRSRKRTLCLLLAAWLLVLAVQPPPAYALTGGPSQPETQAFQAASTTDMVDVFSGDFSYNIPLFELPGPNGGYPFNLAYQSSIGMDQEASWVGLGWNLQPGSVSRQMRGLPDEFNGDAVYTKMSVAPSVTVGLGAGVKVEVFGGDASLGLGLGVSQNNYKGFGYSVDASLGFEKAVSGMTGGLGLNVGLDSKEGVNVNPSLSLKGKLGEFGLGSEYNSKEGLHNLSFTHSTGSKQYKYPNKLRPKEERTWSVGGFASSASLSLAHPGYTPQITMPMSNVNLAATFKAGAAWWGIFGAPYVRGYYNQQTLTHDRKRLQAPAYGYLHYQDATASDALMDFNREKDGLITQDSPNLAIPSLTYDIYSATGQGFSAMYRPMRNDYGIVRDPEVSSETAGGAIGVDVGPAASHVGVNLNVNFTKSTSGGWSANNQLARPAKFQQRRLNDPYEPWYFKVHGEANREPAKVLDDLKGAEAVRVRLSGANSDPVADAALENATLPAKAAPSTDSYNRERKPRHQVVQPVTNQQVLSGATEQISLFKVKYRDAGGAEVNYSRSGLPKHHPAGYTALTAEGLRYTYAIPAYNLYQEETSFSVKKSAGQVARVNAGNNGQGDPSYSHNNTDQLLKRTEMPAYAHSYLLTSVVGPDYVDVTGDGVSVDDLGYWVKFTYRKTTTDTDRYKWRDPFSKAHYQEGWKTDPRDDKGSFTYGEKELWYLDRAETKSHVARFYTSARKDGFGVAAKLQDTDARGKAVHRLDSVQLYTRSAGSAHPLKWVKLEYDASYPLCPGVHNSSEGKGKLTLKKVWFEYGSSKRGRLNPYVFAYHTSNPAYDIHAYDRWGNYKPYPAGNYQYNHDAPYVEQDPANQQAYADRAASWSLQKITLPSGGQIQVDYEADDYGYVQHEVATQMTKVVDPYQSSATAAGSAKFELNSGNLKVRFPLEKPLPGSQPVDGLAEVRKYLDSKRKQLFFKLKINLRSPGEDFYEFISGYADIDFAQPMGLEKDAQGRYAYGYFHVTAENGRHPFAMRAWQHLRTNQPELANSGRKLDPTTDTNERVNLDPVEVARPGQVRRGAARAADYAEGQLGPRRGGALRPGLRIHHGGKRRDHQ